MTNNILAMSGAAEFIIYNTPCFLQSEFVFFVERRKAGMLGAGWAGL